jgi:hypothetical protein
VPREERGGGIGRPDPVSTDEIALPESFLPLDFLAVLGVLKLHGTEDHFTHDLARCAMSAASRGERYSVDAPGDLARLRRLVSEDPVASLMVERIRRSNASTGKADRLTRGT